MASFLYKFRGELMFCMGITSSQFHPDKILGEMYFTHDFLKGDFCFQNNFWYNFELRTLFARSPKLRFAENEIGFAFRFRRNSRAKLAPGYLLMIIQNTNFVLSNSLRIERA